MKVKTLRPHQNQFGQKYSKVRGDEYEHPNPATDIKFGYVESVAATAPSPDGNVDGGVSGGDGAAKGSAKK